MGNRNAFEGEALLEPGLRRELELRRIEHERERRAKEAAEAAYREAEEVARALRLKAASAAQAAEQRTLLARDAEGAGLRGPTFVASARAAAEAFAARAREASAALGLAEARVEPLARRMVQARTKWLEASARLEAMRVHTNRALGEARLQARTPTRRMAARPPPLPERESGERTPLQLGPLGRKP